MTETLIPDVMCKIDRAALYKALQAAAPAAIGAPLNRASTLLLMAQIQEETGFKACHCWNLGNVKHVTGDGHNYCEFTCGEVIDGKAIVIEAGQPGSQFRAYANLAEGCTDYLRLLKKGFAGAWAFVEGGDPHGFVRALSLEHYFTASEAIYERSVAALDAELAREIPEEPALEPMAPLVVAGLTQESKLEPVEHEVPDSLEG